MYNPETLSDNIRIYRKNANLTQAQLAERIFVSAQNVSKWELGVNSPDINNLCALAEVFNISVDTLLGISSTSPEGKALIAIDGGGTKTEVVLFTENGEILYRNVYGSSNPNVCGMDTTFTILKNAVDTCLSYSKNVHAIFAGMAGLGSKGCQSEVKDFMKKTYPNIKLKIGSDILNVIYSAEPMDKCLAVISGTGCIAYAKNGDKLNRMGGWGYLFDRGGSGYDFGRDAICAALAETDGSGIKTLITKSVEKKLGGNALENIDTAYKAGKDFIASFCPIVFYAFEKGDEVAANIIENNAKALASLINTAAAKHDCGNTVIISGGLISKQKPFKDAVIKLVDPNLKLIFPTTPQILGAAANCAVSFASPCENFKEILRENYNKYLAKKEK